MQRRTRWFRDVSIVLVLVALNCDLSQPVVGQEIERLTGVWPVKMPSVLNLVGLLEQELSTGGRADHQLILVRAWCDAGDIDRALLLAKQPGVSPWALWRCYCEDAKRRGVFHEAPQEWPKVVKAELAAVHSGEMFRRGLTIPGRALVAGLDLEGYFKPSTDYWPYEVTNLAPALWDGERRAEAGILIDKIVAELGTVADRRHRNMTGMFVLRPLVERRSGLLRTLLPLFESWTEELAPADGISADAVTAWRCLAGAHYGLGEVQGAHETLRKVVDLTLGFRAKVDKPDAFESQRENAIWALSNIAISAKEYIGVDYARELAEKSFDIAMTISEERREIALSMALQSLIEYSPVKAEAAIDQLPLGSRQRAISYVQLALRNERNGLIDVARKQLLLAARESDVGLENDIKSLAVVQLVRLERGAKHSEEADRYLVQLNKSFDEKPELRTRAVQDFLQGGLFNEAYSAMREMPTGKRAELLQSLIRRQIAK